MADKELTQSEFARMGAQATNSKYSKEERSAWAKKGVEARRKKYGDDYHVKLAAKARAAIGKKKKKGFLSILGIK